jgi:phosphoribosylanthranilate isomerase
MLVQIYGITTVDDARAVDELGADLVGVVLDEGFDAWDAVAEEEARSIVSAVTRASVVALSLATDLERIVGTWDMLWPSVLHLARASAMKEKTLVKVRAEIAPAELMLTVPVSGDGAAAVALAQRLAPFADSLLLDTVHPSTGLVGATGQVHDWSVSAAIVQAVDVPVLLAGGLGPDNVRQAVHQVGPAGVDSETRTSRADDRRRKDLDKVAAFIAAARAGDGNAV